MGVDKQTGSAPAQPLQPYSQPTQQASLVYPNRGANIDIWGELIPRNRAVTGYKFLRAQQTYRVGSGVYSEGEERDKALDIVLAGPFVCGLHCTIKREGSDTCTSDSESAVTVIDSSYHGTFINKEKIGYGKFRILRDGDEISFGRRIPKYMDGEDDPLDYRFIFRAARIKSLTTGVHEHYDVCHELGRGSFAVVSKAMCKTTGKWYAVKNIRVHQLDLPLGWAKAYNSPQMRNHPTVKRIVRESQILNTIAHKNICELKQWFYEEHRISLVLELVPGGDLLRYIQQKDRALAEHETGHIVYQICDALAYIHSLRIAHRDLKLENILVTLDQPPIVKLADFGLAKAFDSFTSLRSLCGTRMYLAPEVIDGTLGGYTTVVDSWSLGVIAFIMLTKIYNPYVPGTTDADLKTQATTRTVHWELLQHAGVSQQCEDFLRGLFEHDPGQRTTSAEALRHPWLLTHAKAATMRGETHALVPASPTDPIRVTSSSSSSRLPASSHRPTASPSTLRDSTRQSPIHAQGRATAADDERSPLGSGVHASVAVALAEGELRAVVTVCPGKRQREDIPDTGHTPIPSPRIGHLGSYRRIYSTDPAPAAVELTGSNGGGVGRVGSSPSPKRVRIFSVDGVLSARGSPNTGIPSPLRLQRSPLGRRD